MGFEAYLQPTLTNKLRPLCRFAHCENQIAIVPYKIGANQSQSD